MSFLGAILSGPVSRSAETISEHRLLRDGHSTKEKFEELLKKDAEKIINAQEKGFAFVSAGQANWLDLLRPFSFFNGFRKRNSSGEDSVGPVTRWYSTNTFYRKPEIISKITAKGNELSSFLPEIEDRKGVLFLPGPYSFSRLVQNSFYNDNKELVLDYAQAIALNLDSLKEKGYFAVIFSEPSFGFDFLKESFDEKLLVKGFAGKIKEKNFTLGINFPLADASKAIPLIEETAFDFIGVDCFYSDFSGIKTKKDVFLGLVDGSRIGIESIESVKKTIKDFKLNASFSGNFFIGPNDRLFDVPFEQGLEKINILSKAAAGLSGEE
ncbi:hypothetical protein KKG83_01975 [Candidatus Micrarchaeota archaeon]|nr:hypothetical protein [Candidatus Micrarchaeota archaeon]